MQCYPLCTNISCWTKVEKSTCILISRDKEISWLEAVGLATGPSVSRLPCLCLYSTFVSDRFSSGFSGRAPSVRRRAPRVPWNASLSDYRAVLATRSQASCVTGLTTRVNRARVIQIYRVTVKDTPASIAQSFSYSLSFAAEEKSSVRNRAPNRIESEYIKVIKVRQKFPVILRNFACTVTYLRDIYQTFRVWDKEGNVEISWPRTHSGLFAWNRGNIVSRNIALSRGIMDQSRGEGWWTIDGRYVSLFNRRLARIVCGIRVCQSREIDCSNFSTSCNAPTKLILSLTFTRSNCATYVCVYAWKDRDENVFYWNVSRTRSLTRTMLPFRALVNFC